MLNFFKKIVNSIKNAYKSILTLVFNEKTAKKPVNIELSQINIRTRYQNQETRPKWVNGLFDDYIRGKIDYIPGLKCKKTTFREVRQRLVR